MTIVEVGCAWKDCGYSPFPMDAQYNERTRRTGESFLCPAGHSNVYNQGRSKEELLQAEVDRLKQRIANTEQRVVRLYHETRQCPWPTCREYVYSTRHSMYDHMQRIHGMPLLSMVREAS